MHAFHSTDIKVKKNYGMKKKCYYFLFDFEFNLFILEITKKKFCLKGLREE